MDIISCWVAIILFLLFETNFLIEYSKKLNFNLPYKNDYLKIIESGGSIHYLLFLKRAYSNFWINLFTCYVCLSVWLSFIFSIISFNLLEFPKINFYGLVGYLILKILAKYSVN